MAGIRALPKQKWGFNLKTVESSRDSEQGTVQSDKLSMTLYHIKERGIERQGREPPTGYCRPGGKLWGPELDREDAGNQGV